MKTIITMLVGIATLFGGVIGSVATADDHRHLYIVGALPLRSWAGGQIRLTNTLNKEVTATVQVYDDDGTDVGNTTVTVPVNGLVKVPYLTLRGPTNGDFDSFRTVHITTNGEVLVNAWQSWNRMYGSALAVYHRVLPHTRNEPCPGVAKTCD